MNTQTPVRKSRAVSAAVACLCACWILSGIARAQESPMLDYVDQKLLDIGAQLQNAKMRLTKDFAGVAPGGDGQPTTPVLECCRPNLETIARKLSQIRAAMIQMLEYYRGQRDVTAVGLLSDMNVRLETLHEGMIHFARAPDKARAFDARAGLIRPWNEFRNGIDALRGCCPIPPEVVPEAVEEGAGKAGKNQGKQDDAEQGSKGP